MKETAEDILRYFFFLPNYEGRGAINHINVGE